MNDSRKKLRIGLAVRYFMNVGGMEKFSLSLATFLRDRGHKVRVIAIRGNPMEGVSLRILRSAAPIPRAMRDWATARLLARAANEEQVDVMLGEQKTWNCDVLRPAGGIEEEYWKAHMRFRRILPFPQWTRFLALKRVFDLLAEQRGYKDPKLKSVIVNSKLVRQQLLTHYPHLAGKIYVIYEGITSNLHLTDGRSLRCRILRSHGLSENGITAVFVGHDFRRKGLPQALEAIAQARRTDPSFCLQMLVLGRDKSLYCRNLVRRLGLENAVAFVGSVSPPDPCFAAADFLMLPTFYDPFANVTLEALAAGLPILTTRQNGGSEVLTHGVDGWVLDDPRDIRRITDCLLSMRKPDLLSSMKSAAAALAAKHTLTCALESVETILLEAADRKRQAS